MREWTSQFVSGVPLYDTEVPPPQDDELQPSAEELLDNERKLLLDEGDFNEYRVGLPVTYY